MNALLLEGLKGVAVDLFIKFRHLTYYYTYIIHVSFYSQQVYIYKYIEYIIPVLFYIDIHYTRSILHRYTLYPFYFT